MLFSNTGTDQSPTFDAGVFLKVGPTGSKADIDVGARACATVVDWDSDGRRDLVVGGYDGLVHIFLNAGTEEAPDFEAQTFAQDSGVNLDVVSGRASPHVGDLDNDGRKDLLAGNTNGEIVFYPNTGTDRSPDFLGCEFVEADNAKIDLAGTPRSRPFVCDWNADGQGDVLIGAGDGLVRFFLGINHEAGVSDGFAGGALSVVRFFPARPNPFGASSVLAFELDTTSRISVSVYDVSGRHVATLVDRVLPPGLHEVPWDATDRRGADVASGIYFARAVTAGDAATIRLVVLR